MEIENEEIEILMEQEPYQHSTGGAVNSVNGQTGDVVLTTSDLENTSDYQTGAEVQTAISTAIAGKQDTLTAGDNITIQNNVISATGGASYTAGNAITIENNTINADIYPADYFTAGGTVTGSGSIFTLDKTIPATLKSVKVNGNTVQDGTPTPDAPVDIDVVTGTQTVMITGKNLVDYLGGGYIENGASAVISGDKVLFTKLEDSQYGKYSVLKLDSSQTSALLNKTVNISYNKDLTVANSSSGIRVYWMAENGTLVGNMIYNGVTTTSGEQSFHFSVPATAPDNTKPLIALLFYPDLTHDTAEASAIMSVSNLQLELGSTATDYEPYQSQTFTLNLGSYEFCKIGDYQDYIYKSGDNWYWHKEIDKVALGSLTWSPDSTNQTGIYRMSTNDLSGLFAPPRAISVAFTGLSTHFVSVPANSSGTYGAHEGISANATGVAMQIYHSDYNTNTSETAFTTWLTNNDVLLYYALKEPGDIVLGGTLKQQLDALAEARSYLDVTNFIVTTTGTNLPIILDVEALRNSADGVALREPKIPEVIDTLDSTDTKNALSANMGHVLNESISNVQETVYDAYDIRYITGDMEPNWPEEEPDGFRIEVFEPHRIYYTDANAPVKIYYSDNDSLNDFVGYIQVDTTEEDVESENPTTIYGFKLTQMNGADNTPEIYVGQSSMNWNDNELTSLSFEQVGAGGGGSTYNVYSTKTTSNSSTGGAIYLGNLDSSQVQIEDPTTTDGHKRYFWALPSDNSTIPTAGTIVIGGRGNNNYVNNYCAIGVGAKAGSETVALGGNAQALGPGAISIGYGAADNTHSGSISLGWGAKTTRDGEMNIGTYNSSFGFNNTNYRVIGGVHNGQDAHDAATVAQGNTLATSAPTTSTVGVLGQLYTDTTTMHTYQCTDTTGGVYTWTQRW